MTDYSDYYKSTGGCKDITTTSTVEISSTEYGQTKRISKDIRVTTVYYYGMKKLDYEFEIRRKFLFIPFWTFIGMYHDYEEGFTKANKRINKEKVK